jgi:P22 coat protein - gene protein 5
VRPRAIGTNGLQAVNSVTKATLPYLKQFVVTADANADGTGAAVISISPPIISATTGNSAAQRTVHQAMSGSSAITVLGTASTVYLQNLVFHKNAFALAVVPMQKPAGAVDVARKSYKGLSVSVIPYYDGANDISNYRLDVLFGVKTLDGRLATWLSGSPLRLIERFVVVPLDLAPAWLACATPGSFCGANRLRTIGWSAV